MRLESLPKAENILILDASDTGSYELLADTMIIINQTQQDWYLATGAYDTLRVDLFNQSWKQYNSYAKGWGYPITDGLFFFKILQSSPLLSIKFRADTSILVIHRISQSEKNLSNLASPHLLSKDYVTNENQQGMVLISFLAGVLLTLAAYNLLIYFSAKDRVYIYYAIRVLLFLLLWACLYNFCFKWFWPQFPLWNKYATWVVISIYGTITISFSNSYLEIPRIAPKLFQYSKLIIAGYALFGMLSFVSLTYFIFYNLLAPILFLPLAILSIKASKKEGFEHVKFYRLAFGVFLASVLISVISRFLPFNLYLQQAVLLGVLMEALLFSRGLADRISVFKKQAEERKQKLLVQTAENRIISSNLEEKELLLREIHHRVKNNLQLISSLLNLQKSYITDRNALVALDDCQSRVRSMGLVHQVLYSSNELKEVNLENYLSDLTQLLCEPSRATLKNFVTEISFERVLVTIEIAIPLGLIVNELVTNACKYAVPVQPYLSIQMSVVEDAITLTVKDKGPGLTNFNIESPVYGSLGLQLVSDLTLQLNGTISYSYKDGAVFVLTIPVIT